VKSWTRPRASEAALLAAGVEAVVKLGSKTVHLLAGLSADQYAAELRGQIAAQG
jgi:PTS system glucose-specific IIC component